jgi:hypothetical protein
MTPVRPRPRPAPVVAPSAALLAVFAALVALNGCGVPPDVVPTPAGPLPLPVTPGPPGGPATPPPALPPPTLPERDEAAVSCAGAPDGDAVLAVLRDASLLTADQGTVTTGPLCADTWQYTVVSVPDRDPLRVVTSGPPDDLTLVTAGTDVCTIEVRVHAPTGILVAASCVG